MSTQSTVGFHNILADIEQEEPRVSNKAMLAPLQRAIFGVQKVANENTLDPEIGEYVKIRASQINGCAYCLSMHWRDALKMGMRPDKLATLSAWREAAWFTPRERAALAWTEALTHLTTQDATHDLYEQCREVYSEQEMIDLTAAIIAINSWNRLSIGFGNQPEPFSLDGAE